jgi:hypothetical protein
METLIMLHNMYDIVVLLVFGMLWLGLRSVRWGTMRACSICSLLSSISFVWLTLQSFAVVL